MKLAAICLCVLAQIFVVSGQLLFKRAMAPKAPQHARRTAVLLIAGIVTQTAWFFIWDRLLIHWDVSQIYPFEGLNPAMLAVMAWLTLKERMPAIAWVGLTFICVGIGLVTGS
jgi:uncharacterized membrane protein